MRIRSRGSLVAASVSCLGAIGALAMPMASNAATVTVAPVPCSMIESKFGMCSPDVLRVTAAPGEANDMKITSEQTATGSVTRIVDDGAPLTAGPGCTQMSSSVVTCPGSTNWVVDLGDRDDRLDSDRGEISGGPGDDVLRGGTVQGGPGDDTIVASDADGGAGDDTITCRSLTDTTGCRMLHGGPGRDRITGGPLDDAISGGGGDDVLDGGGGIDRVSYSYRKAAVVVNLATAPQTVQMDGERDAISAFEVVEGSAGDDVLIGARGVAVAESGPIPSSGGFEMDGGLGDDRIVIHSPTTVLGGWGDDRIVSKVRSAARLSRWFAWLSGGPGNDRVTGGPGPDYLLGGRGRDVLRGRGGSDHIFGQGGADRLDGGAGADHLAGGPGSDLLLGGYGSDKLIGGPGIDRLLCGPGRRDKAFVDGRDRVLGCERTVKR